MRKDAQDDYGAELSWAFAKAKVSDDISIRVGRIGLPAYMISNCRNAGYANTMLRLPSEVYSQMVFNTVDGADVIWQHSYGAATYTAQLAEPDCGAFPERRRVRPLPPFHLPSSSPNACGRARVA